MPRLYVLYCYSYIQIRKFYLRKLIIVFLPINLNMCFGCSKGPSHCDGSFEYPHHMFWMRNKEDNIPIRTLIWRPGYSHLKWCLMAKSSQLMPLINTGNYRGRRVLFMFILFCWLNVFVFYMLVCLVVKLL